MISRRAFVVLGGLGLAGCRRSLAGEECNETRGPLPEDEETRSRIEYADRTMDAARSCATCQQYVGSPSEGACGGCKLLKGPIHPRGTCKLYAARS